MPHKDVTIHKIQEKEIENAFPASRNEYNRLCDRKLRGYTYSGDSSLSTPLSCNTSISNYVVKDTL